MYFCMLYLLFQVRTIRNGLFHTASFKVSDADMNAHIDAMVLLLQDHILSSDPLAKSAIGQLQNVSAWGLVMWKRWGVGEIGSGRYRGVGETGVWER